MKVFLKLFVSIVVFAFVFSATKAASTTTTQHIEIPRATIMVIPSSGKGPLEVQATITVDSPLTCTSFYLDWGDGSNPVYYEPQSFTNGCVGGNFKRTFTHTYNAKNATTTTYKIKAKAGPLPLDQLSFAHAEVVVYGPKWRPTDPANPDNQEIQCFLDKNFGFAPLEVKTVVSLGAGVCSKDRPMKYWIEWGDGSKTREYICNSSEIAYKILDHTYTKSGNYTAKLFKQYAIDEIYVETCNVEVFKDPYITFVEPNQSVRHISIGYPFVIKIGVKDIPPPISDIYPTIILGFTNTKTKEYGFIGEIGSTTAPILATGTTSSSTATTTNTDSEMVYHSFEWTPSLQPSCSSATSTQEYQDSTLTDDSVDTDLSTTSTTTMSTTTNDIQSQDSCNTFSTPIKPGVYTIDAHLVYRSCTDLNQCNQEEIGLVKTISTHPIEFTLEKSIYNVVADRIFAIPQSAAAPAYVYFTLVLNSDASCQGGTYTLEFGDGKSATLAYPKGYCKSFTESFAHIYQRPGYYLVTLKKNGIPAASLPVVVTNSGILNKSNLFTATVLEGIGEKFSQILGKILLWLGIR